MLRFPGRKKVYGVALIKLAVNAKVFPVFSYGDLGIDVSGLVLPVSWYVSN